MFAIGGATPNSSKTAGVILVLLSTSPPFCCKTTVLQQRKILYHGAPLKGKEYASERT
jgi:hypothetical protein